MKLRLIDILALRKGQGTAADGKAAEKAVITQETQSPGQPEEETDGEHFDYPFPDITDNPYYALFATETRF